MPAATNPEILMDMAGAELLALEREELELSARRRRLHELIDGGQANDIVLAQERRLSAERRAVHERIDLLRGQLNRCWGA